MMKAAFVRVRIEPSLKENAEGILHKLGISSSEAVNLFYSQIVLKRGLPFPVELPNDETIKAMEASNNRESLTHYKTADEMFKKLGI